ncbi:MAG TPA: hypothetical protein PLK80_04420 [bacterium]|nr:hypothetical protein [bacterium]HPI75955.1 hypothetical protein [bacterium]
MSDTTVGLQVNNRNARSQVPMKVAAASKILSGTFTVVNKATGGLEVYKTSTLTNRYYAGFAAESVDNSAGLIGEKLAAVFVDGEFECAFSGTFTQASVGLPAYAKDNHTCLAGAYSTNRLRAGTVSQYISSTLGMVRIDNHTLTGATI